MKLNVIITLLIVFSVGALVLPVGMVFAVDPEPPVSFELFEIFELGNGSRGFDSEGKIIPPDPGSADIVGDEEQPGPDWADIFTYNNISETIEINSLHGGLAAIFIQDDLALKGKTDDTTFTGSKNDDPRSTWQWVTGNVPSKDDLSNVYLFATTLTKTPDTNDLILYAGIERVDPNGDSHIDIEISQNPIYTDTNGGFVGEKDENDILLVMDFEKGGDLGFVEIYKWNGVSWGLPIEALNNGNGEGCNLGSDDPFIPANVACAFNNEGNIDNGEWDDDGILINGGWDSYNKQDSVIHTLERNAFTEMGINVTELLGNDVGTPCFTSVLAKSRSSSSLTSDLKDFAIGRFNLCDARVSFVGDGNRISQVGETQDLTVLAEGGKRQHHRIHLGAC
jgi:hypothetical protein